MIHLPSLLLVAAAIDLAAAITREGEAFSLAMLGLDSSGVVPPSIAVVAHKRLTRAKLANEMPVELRVLRPPEVRRTGALLGLQPKTAA